MTVSTIAWACTTLACAALAAGAAAVAPLPATIDPDAWGTPSFDERFLSFDQGVDQVQPAKPHRWRTVAGFGGPYSESNRQMSGTSFASDREFAGVKGNAAGPHPLGLDPFLLDPGNSLTILAARTPAGVGPLAWQKPYYGGRISTRFSFSQLFGYFEIDAILPAGKGMWPAFWLLPVSGRWPINGELDVLEGLGNPREIYSSVISSKQKQVNTRVALPFDASAGFHRYGAAWGPKEIVWYADRREVARTPTPADMKAVPMHIIANLAVGGAWGGYPTAQTVFPKRYVIRRIAAWRLPATFAAR